ncbi:MAG: hypothetical protein KGJ88_01525 [Verrucomicrobiota bacterium]|nr:hypothetical protein [Verrucomicrobiota bacterium]
MCGIAGLALLAWGLLIPAHLRAVDEMTLQMAGRGTSTLLSEGDLLASERKLGAAWVLARAAATEKIPGSAGLTAMVTGLARQHPDAYFWGDDSHAKSVFAGHFDASEKNLSLSDFIIRGENRAAALADLQKSSVAAVQELLRSRSLQHTVLLPASGSASGQVYDGAVCICGLLLDENRLTGNFSAELLGCAQQANAGRGSEPLERALMDFLSLGQRFNWDQLAAFTAEVPDMETLDRLAEAARADKAGLPELFAAVQLSGDPANVTAYAAKFSETGLSDLGQSLRDGAGGTGELAKSGKRLYHSKFERATVFGPAGAIFRSGARLAVQGASLAMGVKWLLYMVAGFLLALGLHFAVPAVEQPLQVRGFHLAREFLFSAGFLLVVLLLSEPFLAQESQRGNHFSLRLLPTSGTVAAEIAGIKQTVMNPTILITLLVFFVLQALLYISCLVKLAEIRRQNVPPRMKLKLLENEDHLFDAGLYLGFVGTIVSLIMASLGLVKFSLMAAYSSTSFGIIFVVIFKIFHLRPLRRRLLMEAEMQGMSEPPRPAAAPPAPTPALP